MKKVYLGDAVYADYDGYSLILTTHDGFSDTNTIYLEADVLSALQDYLVALAKEAARGSVVEKLAGAGSAE